MITKIIALAIINKSRTDTTTFPIDIELSPNGEIGIKLMGPAIIATNARIIIAKLRVAIITEKIGSSFNGRLMMKSRNKPNSTENIILHSNAAINVQADGFPLLDKKVDTKKKLA